MSLIPKHMVDLSLKLSSNLAVYPGDPEIEIKRFKAMPDDRINMLQLKLTTHHGTHLDAPNHQINGGHYLDDYPLRKFISRAVKIDLVSKEPGQYTHLKDGILYSQVVTRKDLEAYEDDIAGHQALTINTGYGPVMQRGLVDNDFPYFSAGAARFISRFDQLDIVGIDSLSADVYGGQEAHQILFGQAQRIVLLESLINLESLPKEFTLICLPLHIGQADGAPCRAVACWE